MISAVAFVGLLLVRGLQGGWTGRGSYVYMTRTLCVCACMREGGVIDKDPHTIALHSLKSGEGSISILHVEGGGPFVSEPSSSLCAVYS